MKNKNTKLTQRFTKQELFELIKKEGETSSHHSQCTEYYLSRYQQQKQNPLKLGTNWAACFATPVWLWYRKMYTHYFVLLGAFLTIKTFNAWCLMRYTKIFPLACFGLIAPICFLTQGDSLYFRFLRNKAKKGTKHVGVNSLLLSTVLSLSVPIGILTVVFFIFALTDT